MRRVVWFFGFAGMLLMVHGCVRPVRTTTIRIDSKPEGKFTGSFQKPVKGGRITSRFGHRGKSYHTGIDIKRNRRGGDPVLAARSGRVIMAKRWKGYGKMVSIKHADGSVSRYAHLRKILVKKGQKVKTGQKIGIVGSTGRVSGPHLHFEILTPTGRFVDPEPFIKGR